MCEHPLNINYFFRVGPYPGFDVLHCHLLQHEDNGCMKVTSMYCPGTNPSEKQPAKCSSIVYPVKGTVVLGKGYGDPAYGEEITDNNSIQISPSANATSEQVGALPAASDAGIVSKQTSLAVALLVVVIAALIH